MRAPKMRTNRRRRGQSLREGKSGRAPCEADGDHNGSIDPHAQYTTIVPSAAGILPHMVRLGLALASATLLVAAFPDPDQGWLAWIALAPLALACRDLRPIPAATLGLPVGGVAAFGVCSWRGCFHTVGRHQPASPHRTAPEAPAGRSPKKLSADLAEARDAPGGIAEPGHAGPVMIAREWSAAFAGDPA
jgi:hypothetical protein